MAVKYVGWPEDDVTIKTPIGTVELLLQESEDELSLRTLGPRHRTVLTHEGQKYELSALHLRRWRNTWRPEPEHWGVKISGQRSKITEPEWTALIAQMMPAVLRWLDEHREIVSRENLRRVAFRSDQQGAVLDLAAHVEGLRADAELIRRIISEDFKELDWKKPARKLRAAADEVMILVREIKALRCAA